MHRIFHIHRVYGKNGPGELLLCSPRFWPGKVDGAVVFNEFPDTTYFIERITKEEIQKIKDSKDQFQLSTVISKMYLDRSGSKYPVTWQFYAPE